MVATVLRDFHKICRSLCDWWIPRLRTTLTRSDWWRIQCDFNRWRMSNIFRRMGGNSNRNVVKFTWSKLYNIDFYSVNSNWGIHLLVSFLVMLKVNFQYQQHGVLDGAWYGVCRELVDHLTAVFSTGWTAYVNSTFLRNGVRTEFSKNVIFPMVESKNFTIWVGMFHIYKVLYLFAEFGRWLFLQDRFR